MATCGRMMLFSGILAPVGAVVQIVPEDKCYTVSSWGNRRFAGIPSNTN